MAVIKSKGNCWNCGFALDEEDWCARCGRLQSDDAAVELVEGRSAEAVFIRSSGAAGDLALLVNDPHRPRFVRPASSKGIRIKLRRSYPEKE